MKRFNVLIWIALGVLFGLILWWVTKQIPAEATFTHRDWSNAVWSDWSKCEGECGQGEGTQYRIKTRKCEFELFGTDHCTLNEVEVVDRQERKCEMEVYQCEEPTPEVTPTEEPTPTPVPCEHDCTPTFAASTTNAPSCPDKSTTNVVANPHVIRAGESATVNFFITEGDSANIFYSEVGLPHWQHAVANVKPNNDRFVSYTVHGLVPALGYDFGIQQKFGCSGGQTTAVIVDDPSPRLFMISYWE